jgi:hypothetical protein
VSINAMPYSQPTCYTHINFAFHLKLVVNNNISRICCP